MSVLAQNNLIRIVLCPDQTILSLGISMVPNQEIVMATTNSSLQSHSEPNNPKRSHAARHIARQCSKVYSRYNRKRFYRPHLALCKFYILGSVSSFREFTTDTRQLKRHHEEKRALCQVITLRYVTLRYITSVSQ